MTEADEPQDYAAKYSDDGFWQKLRSYALKAGAQAVEKALWLYYVLQKPNLPGWARATVIGALGYFIFPADAIPDFVPAVGYADDLGVLAAAVAAVAVHIDEEVRRKAREKMRQWFGDDDLEEPEPA